MEIKDTVIILALILNFVGVLFAIFNSKIALEHRLTRVETMVAVALRGNPSKGRSTDNDYAS